MNTRDIRELLRGNIDPRLGKVLISQQEDIAALKQMVMQLAGLIDAILNNQIKQANAVEQMRHLRPLAEKQRQVAIAVGSDPSMTGEHDE